MGISGTVLVGGVSPDSGLPWVLLLIENENQPSLSRSHSALKAASSGSSLWQNQDLDLWPSCDAEEVSSLL